MISLFRLAVPFTLILCGACASPTFVSKHGLRVFDKQTQVTAAQVDAVSDAMVKKLGHAEKLSGVTVHLLTQFIEIPQPDGTTSHADGYTNSFDATIAASVFSPCLFLSGLPHELAHMIHDRDKVPDWAHDDKEFWAEVEALENSLRSQCTAEEIASDQKLRATGKDAPPAPQSP